MAKKKTRAPSGGKAALRPQQSRKPKTTAGEAAAETPPLADFLDDPETSRRPRRQPSQASEEATGEFPSQQSALLALFKDQDTRDALRQMLAACSVPGDDSVTFTRMAREMNDDMMFTSVSSDNLENFVTFISTNPKNEVPLCEYARWLARQFENETPVSKRPIVVFTRKKLTIELLAMIKAALEPGLTEDSHATAVERINTHNYERVLYTALCNTFSAVEETSAEFVENVLAGDDDLRTGQFFMYRYTGKGRRIYRSLYSFTARRDEIYTEMRRKRGYERPNFYITTFRAVGRVASSPVHSTGYVIAQRDIVYLFGVLDSGGIHVVAIPRWTFAARNADRLRGMALSVDIGEAGISPVGAKVLLLRNPEPVPADEAVNVIGPSETEAKAQETFFAGQAWPLKQLSNDVLLALKDAVSVEGHATKVDDYEVLIDLLVNEFRLILGPKVKGRHDGRPESHILPENLRGVTALTLGPRG